MAFAYRGNEEVESRCEYTESCCHHQIAHGAFDKLVVMNADTETYPDDRAHEWRYEQGADNDCRGVGVESQRRDEDGQNKDYDIGAAKRHAVANILLRILLRYQEVAEIEVLGEIFVD